MRYSDFFLLFLSLPPIFHSFRLHPSRSISLKSPIYVSSDEIHDHSTDYLFKEDALRSPISNKNSVLESKVTILTAELARLSRQYIESTELAAAREKRLLRVIEEGQLNLTRSRVYAEEALKTLETKLIEVLLNS